MQGLEMFVNNNMLCIMYYADLYKWLCLCTPQVIHDFMNGFNNIYEDISI